MILQVVSYTADDDGYHPTVEYHGEAHYDFPQDYHPIPSIHISPETPGELPVKNYKFAPTLNTLHDHHEPEDLKQIKLFKYSQTPYPTVPKVFRPKAPSYIPQPTYFPTPLPKHYKNRTPNPPDHQVYNSIHLNHKIYKPTTLHYKGKLVFLDKPQSEKQGSPPLPQHSPAP